MDQFTKYATFIPVFANYITEEAKRLIFKHVIKLWKMLNNILSDKDL